MSDTNKTYHSRNKKSLTSKDKLKLILKLSAEISASKNIRKILKKITDGAKDIMSADRCTVFLIDEDKKELYSWVAHGLKGVEIRFPSTEGIAGYVASYGKTVNIDDAYNHPRFNPDVDKETGYKTRTLLCAPMKNQKGKVMGVFQILNKKGGVFTEEDEEMLLLLCGQATSALESALLYEELKKTFVSFIKTLSETIDARDPVTAGHSRRVCGYAVQIARKMGYSGRRIEILQYAALMHDLGKIGVREEILTKPGKLTRDEYLHIQAHAEKTKAILENIYFQPEYREIPPAAYLHHENIDGTGYPLQKTISDIPESARIIAVADVFDSITYERHYRDPMPFNEVIEVMKNYSGTKFDPRCIEAFLDLDIAGVLEVLSGDRENKISKGDMKRLKGKSVAEMLDIIERQEDSSQAEIFRKYYPTRQKSEV